VGNGFNFRGHFKTALRLKSARAATSATRYLDPPRRAKSTGVSVGFLRIRAVAIGFAGTEGSAAVVAGVLWRQIK
jgi:hypothetical protein